MNIKNVSSLIITLIASFMLMSCNDSNTSNTYDTSSKDAQIYSFSMTAAVPTVKDSLEQVKLNKIFAIVNSTKFSIDQVSGTIYNQDSMPFGAVLDKAILSMSFNPSGISEFTIFTPDSISGYQWNFSDSVFVGKSPIQFKVTARDASSHKSYNFDIRIHKIDPDTILWNKMSSYPIAIGESKTVLTNNKFYTYALVNGVSKLYTSPSSALSWKEESLSGLTSVLNPKSLTLLNSVFYGLDYAGKPYKSTNGLLWAAVSSQKQIESIVGVLPGGAISGAGDQLLVIVNDGGKYYFGKTKNMSDISVVSYLSVSPNDNEVPQMFPVKGFSDCSIYGSSTSIGQMLMIAGGVNSSGNEIPYAWLIKNTDKGLELSSDAKNMISTGVGLSLFRYNDKMYILDKNQFYISGTWGQEWTKAPNKQMLSPDMLKRNGQTVIVDSQNYIWIFGGVSQNSQYLNDVWRGRLNSLIP